MSPACVVRGLAWGGLANPTDQGGQLSPFAGPPSFITCVTGSGQPGLLEGPCGWSQPGGLRQAQQDGHPCTFRYRGTLPKNSGGTCEENRGSSFP